MIVCMIKQSIYAKVSSETRTDIKIIIEIFQMYCVSREMKIKLRRGYNSKKQQKRLNIHILKFHLSSPSPRRYILYAGYYVFFFTLNLKLKNMRSKKKSLIYIVEVFLCFEGWFLTIRNGEQQLIIKAKRKVNHF